MENRLFCTIITPDYLYKALSMLLSLQKIQVNAPLLVLSTEEIDVDIPNLKITSLSKLCEVDNGAVTIAKKYSRKKDEMRWSLKPVWMRYILNNYPNSDVMYCDCDFCFFEPPEYLFKCLEKGGIVLTPHWRHLCPTKSSANFRFNFKDGLFNAGCVTANKLGLPALDWWAAACASACELNREEGLFYDQKYLDLMIVYFSETVVSRHQGINIADWNMHLRQTSLNNKASVPSYWPIVSIHFTVNTIRKIENGLDPVLEPYYAQYLDLIKTASIILNKA